METKKEKIVSVIQEKIIHASIESLKKEGLKFSVDMLAENLKISKKTIYKYFPNKEALSRAIYERYYDNLEEEIQSVFLESKNRTQKLLFIYYDSHRMVNKDIFNKYKLNDVIYRYALKRHFHIWEKLLESVSIEQSEDEISALKIIIDGSLKELCIHDSNPAFVIERLVQTICSYKF
ncbi:MAG TPA: TetR/AcrR family transcriptional regulator [Firmicutes bacterium]|nr:TetR/AcrR family transcriptional regulator [Bacillota bacterium]